MSGVFLVVFKIDKIEYYFSTKSTMSVCNFMSPYNECCVQVSQKGTSEQQFKKTKSTMMNKGTDLLLYKKKLKSWWE